MPDKFAAIYVRVSTNKQDHRSQMPDLERWASSQDLPVEWFTDKFSGKSMERPGWRRLYACLKMGAVSSVVVWRLDRLGRTASGLTALFDELNQRNVNLVSLKDNVDLSTAAGRLMANVIASVAQYDNELRSERVVAGQAVARAAGKTWGGSKPGTRGKITDLQRQFIRESNDRGESKTEIAVATGLSRQTIYAVLEASNA